MLTSPITIDPSSIFSLAAAIKAGITTPELLESALLEGELVEGALVIDPLYYATDCGGGVGDGFETAEQAANDFASTFDTPEETEWIEITTFREGADSDGNVVRVDVEYLTRTLEPDEPECTEGEHDWQSPYEILGGCKENPGVWGHGGGVISSEVCMKCGCERVTDTWAQNPNNGEQGLRSTSYEPGKYSDQVAASEGDNWRKTMTLVEKHTLGDNFDFAAFLAEWIATDWKAVGVEDAGKCQELAECGYSNPQSNGTPWSDGEPDAARGTKYLTSDFDLTPEEEESWKAAEHDASNKYNAGFVEAENKAIEQLAAERAADLARADAAGWRICQFGLPGSNTHVVRVAPPGEADRISSEIFRPGPCGPYDSSILKPSEADNAKYQDGTAVYGEEIDEIMAEVAKSA